MYKDIISINKNFQYSVNLDYDISNIEKLNEYIPTSDVCDVLRKYVDSILGLNKMRSTTLVGPYGKGKTFLLLVLVQICSKNSDEKILSNLISKIGKVDNELAEKLLKIRNSKKYLLPVIVNSSYNNLSQSFLLGLKESLERENLSNIIPSTSFDECVKVIDSWSKDETGSNSKLNKCLKERNIDINNLRDNLKKYSEIAYEEFVGLYNCVIVGQSFNPLINDNVVKTFSDINHKICEKGYNGMLIIFDEFSKFIESNSPTLSQDLKVLQDFAEKASRSKNNEQLHLCCITHKPMTQYLKTEESDSIIKDVFKTVEGRFKEIRFNRGIQQNFEIISSAINKKENFDEVYNSFRKKHEKEYMLIKQMRFCEKANVEETLFKGCFPINPIAVFCVIDLCEAIAQNERTLFTFLSDNDENSFHSFISNNNDGLFDLASAYDYFSNLLKTDESSTMRSVWYKTESCLKKVAEKLDKKIIKTLGIFSALAANEYIAPTVDNIALALFVDKKEILSRINNLVNHGVLRINALTSFISFAGYSSKEIDVALKAALSKIKDSEYSSILTNKISRERFLLPRKYNAEKKMTRYYRSIYLDEAAFINLASYENLLETFNSDGLLINVLRFDLSSDSIKFKAESMTNPRVIVRWSNNEFDNKLVKSILSVEGYIKLLQSSEFSDVVKSEIELNIEELSNDIRTLIEEMFSLSNSQFYAVGCDDKNFDESLSYMMNNVYYKTAIINNESLNKHEITTQYSKPRNNVINKILSRIDFNFSETSPEMTILNATYYQKDEQSIRNVINYIKSEFATSKVIRYSLTELSNKLTQPPFGIREGVIPVLIALAIDEINSNFVLYYSNKEVDFTAENLSKCVLPTSKVFLRITKESKKQEAYIKKLFSLFTAEPKDSFRENIKLISNIIRKWFSNLPKVSRTFKSGDFGITIPEEMIQYRDSFLKFDINNYDALFDNSISIFASDDLEDVTNKVLECKNTFSGLKDRIVNDIIKKINLCFESENKDNSLFNTIKKWMNRVGFINQTVILSISTRKLVSLIFDKEIYDDYELANEISSAFIGTRIEDWEINRLDYLLSEIEKSKDELISKVKNGSNNSISNLSILTSKIDEDSLSKMAKIMKRQIENTINEFSESISPEEKVETLISIIKKMM